MNNERIEAYVADLLDAIAKHGWVIQGVFGVREEELPFAYTIGLHEAGLPELIVSGGNMHMMLNIAASDHLRNEIQPGTLYRSNYLTYPLKPIKAPAAEIFFARRLYGPRVKAIQLIWPDNHGLWPGQPGHNPKKRQDFFGTFTIPKEPPCPTPANRTKKTSEP